MGLENNFFQIVRDLLNSSPTPFLVESLKTVIKVKVINYIKEVRLVVTVGTAQGEEMVEVLGGRYLVPTWNELWISNKEIKSHVKKLENKKAIEI